MLSLVAASARADCSAGFKDDADAHVTADYRERRMRGGRTETIHTEAVVSWQPDQMLEDTTCFDMKASELQIRVVDGPSDAWTTVEGRPKVCGAASCWTVDVKPCLMYTFKIVLSSNDLGGTGATLELPGVTVGPAGNQELLDSGYMPDQPTDLTVEAKGTSANLRWNGVDCAQEYYITYKDTADASDAAVGEATVTESETQIDGLKECTRYDVSVTAYLGNEGSDDLQSSFMTKPRTDSLDSLTIQVTSQMTEVDVKWDTYGPVSCIDDYAITVFDPADNSIVVPEQEVRVTTGLTFVEQKIPGLKECTNYQMRVMPKVPELEMTAKFIDFRTASPQASDLSIEQVETAVGETSGTVTLSWTPLKCASSYVIYQKMADGEWIVVTSEAESTEFTVSDITACTKYSFAVAARLADGSETPKTEGQEIMSTLDNSQPFSAPGLEVTNMDTYADIKWNHADCISSYKVRACTEAYTDCPEHIITPGEDKTITFRVEGLEPCTHHELEIIPITPEATVFTAAKHPFTTTNGVPKPPIGFSVTAVGGSNFMGAAHMSWEEAQCATGYTVYRRNSNGEETEVETDGTSQHQDALEPCQEYEFAVATRVDDTVSEKTEWQNIQVQPDNLVSPELKIVSSETDENVTVSLKPSAPNAGCSVAAYEVRYTQGAGKSDTKVYKAEEVGSRGDIRLPVSRDSYITGRIKYNVDSDWTQTASIGDLGRSYADPLVLGGLDNKVLYPTVVGVAVLAIIVIVVTVLILRRKRTMRSFDAEKGAKGAENGKAAAVSVTTENGKKTAAGMNGNDEETQKLNANHDDPENFA